MTKIDKILAMLKKDKIDPEYASPNFIANYSYNRHFRLTGNDIIYISNTYGNFKKYAKVYHVLVDDDISIEKSEKIMAAIIKKYPCIIKVEYHACREINNQ